MTLQQLKYVVEVAERGSITEAAKALFIAQPSLSAAVREREEEAGITIFLRNRTVKRETRFGRLICCLKPSA